MAQDPSGQEGCENLYIDTETPIFDYSAYREAGYVSPLQCNYRPSPTLSPLPSWQQSPFTESPLSNSASDGLYLDPFDQSFGSAEIQPPPLSHTTSNGLYHDPEWCLFNQASSCNPSNEPKLPNAGALKEKSYVSEQSMATIDEAEDDGTDNETASEASTPYHSPLQPTVTSSSFRRHSKSKPKRANSLPPTTMILKPPNRLRTATGTSLRDSSTLSSSTGRSKSAQNKVEKQYRNRLNDQFETLLQALPARSKVSESMSGLSKSEVLTLAQERIVKLEENGKNLEKERKELVRRAKFLNQCRWGSLG